MMNRALVLLVAAPLCALGFSACSDDAEDDDASASGAGATGSGSGASGSGASQGSGGSGAEAGGPSAGGAGNSGPGAGGTGGSVTLSCDEIAQEYDALVGPSSQSCDATDLCQVLNGHCSGGLGGCFHIVNSSVTQADLDALFAQWQAQGCMAGVCDCPPTPTGAGCEQGMCVAHEN